MEEALREPIDLAEWQGWMVLASRSAGGWLHRTAGVIQGLNSRVHTPSQSHASAECKTSALEVMPFVDYGFPRP